MTKKIFIVINPVGGNTNTEVLTNLFKLHITEKFGIYFIYNTTGKEKLPQVIKDAIKDGYNFFIAVGGDGTISGVAEGLVDTPYPLGIIPTGTANCLAKELNIPQDIEQACKVIVTSKKTRRIDAIYFNNSYYFLEVGIGARSMVMKDTKPETKRKFGLLAYIGNGIKWMINFQPRRFIIIADGQTYQKRASEVVVANGSIIGSEFFRYGKNVKIDDGILNICVIRARSILEYYEVARKFFRKDTISDYRVTYINIKNKAFITTKHKPHLPVQADGDIVTFTPIEIFNAPSVVRIIVPKTPKSTLINKILNNESH